MSDFHPLVVVAFASMDIGVVGLRVSARPAGIWCPVPPDIIENVILYIVIEIINASSVVVVNSPSAVQLWHS